MSPSTKIVFFVTGGIIVGTGGMIDVVVAVGLEDVIVEDVRVD